MMRPLAAFKRQGHSPFAVLVIGVGHEGVLLAIVIVSGCGGEASGEASPPEPGWWLLNLAPMARRVGTRSPPLAVLTGLAHPLSQVVLTSAPCEERNPVATALGTDKTGPPATAGGTDKRA